LEAGYPLLTGSILTIHGSNCILGISKIIKLHKCKPWRLAGYPNTETITSHHINQQSRRNNRQTILTLATLHTEGMQVQRKTPAIVILRKMGPPSIFRQGCQCGEPEWEGGKWVSEATRKKKTQDVKRSAASKSTMEGIG